MMSKLRGYQVEMISMLRDSLIRGKRRPVVQMPTGAGKTICAAAIINLAREKNKRVIFCVPALSLIDQTIERFEGTGIWDLGVIQAMHERTDSEAPLQVASVQTLMRRKIPPVDLVIIDECHVNFKFYTDWFNHPDWRNVPFIGLTATPWAKGMGKLWDDLIIGTTTQELIDSKDLCDFKVFAPSHPDLTGVKTIAGDFELKGLGQAMDKAPLVADIVSTWLLKAKDLPTVCFAVNRAHAKHIQQQFVTAGVTAEYMDAYTSNEDRRVIIRRFANKSVKIIVNVGVLTTGFDADVRCIILARPTKSKILFCQMIGRGLRTAEGKDHCLILDHSDTHVRLGFVTDLNEDRLDDGKAKRKAETVAKEKLPKECPQCHFLRPPGKSKCPACGFVAQAVSNVDHVNGELAELRKDRRMSDIKYTLEQKQSFYSELIGYAINKGYKSGWAYHAYRDKFGVAPSNQLHQRAGIPGPVVLSWIRHRNIVNAKRIEKNGIRAKNSTRSVAWNTSGVGN